MPETHTDVCFQNMNTACVDVSRQLYTQHTKKDTVR